MKRKFTWFVFIVGLVIIGLTIIDDINTAGDVKNPEAQLAKMLPSEREFCIKTLWQINTSSNERDVLALLGPPSRSLKYKKNWYITLDGKMDRIGVYLGTDNYATQVVLDGGPGRFYYRRNVKDHEQPRQESSHPIYSPDMESKVPRL